MHFLKSLKFDIIFIPSITEKSTNTSQSLEIFNVPIFTLDCWMFKWILQSWRLIASVSSLSNINKKMDYLRAMNKSKISELFIKYLFLSWIRPFRHSKEVLQSKCQLSPQSLCLVWQSKLSNLSVQFLLILLESIRFLCKFLLSFWYDSGSMIIVILNNLLYEHCF